MNGSNRSRRLEHLLVAGALALALVAPRTALSQDQPVVFIHGLLQNSGEWQFAADELAQQYQIYPIVPTLGWPNSFETQANNLQTALGTVTQAGAMAHSNGGLVLRQYIRQLAASTRINRGFTIGTPHAGVPLVANIENGAVGNWANYVVNSMVDPFDFYYDEDPDFHAAVDNGVLIELPDLVDDLGLLTQSLVFILNQVVVPEVNANVPVSQEMSPGTSFITTLNSAANLNAEQAHLPVRVGTGTGISPVNALFVDLSLDPQTWGDVRVGIEIFAFALYDYYSTSDDYFLQANAYRWLNLVEAMYSFDAVWQSMIGAVVGVTPSGLVIVQQQDGVVPLSSQTWPGATEQHNLLWPATSIFHDNQPFDPAAIRLMGSTVLQVDFGIPLRPPPPTASMSGPTSLTEGDYDTWSATITSGSPPYSYAWTVDGASAGQGMSLNTGGWTGGTSHDILFTVTDEVGRVGSAEMNVYVTYSGGCLQPPCQERR